MNPEVNDLNFDEARKLQYQNPMNISNKGSTVNEESSIDTSDMTEKILVLPVPKNNQPLPQDQWHKVEDIYKILSRETLSIMRCLLVISLTATCLLATNGTANGTKTGPCSAVGNVSGYRCESGLQV